jgi:hypothetical protein
MKKIHALLSKRWFLPVCGLVLFAAGMWAWSAYLDAHLYLPADVIAMPAPTATPTQTPRPPFVPPSDGLYDDFDDPAFDGLVNWDAWRGELSPNCIVEQESGTLVFDTWRTDPLAACLLQLQPRHVRFRKVGAVEARIKATGGCAGTGQIEQGIEIGSSAFLIGYWGSFCGLRMTCDEASGAQHTESMLRIWATAYETDEITTSLPAEMGQWYTFRLEVDPDTAAVRCYTDDALIAEHVPNNVDLLDEILFARYLVRVNTGAHGLRGIVDSVAVSSPATP